MDNDGVIISSIFYSLHNEKKRSFAIGLAIQFLNCNDHLQFIVFLHCECHRTSCMSCRIAIHCIYDEFHYNTITTILKPLTTMQLHYNYSHNIMLTLIFFIHPLKLDMWHYEIFWINFFWNTDIHLLLWLLMVRYYDMWPNKKLSHGILNKNWKIKLKKWILIVR
jgi:hypothetical protein